MRSLGIGVLVLITLPTGHVRAEATEPAPGFTPGADTCRAEDDPPAGADAARDRGVLAKLETRVTLRHPKGAPLRQVVSDIAKATRGPNDSGIPVYVDPVGLMVAERTMDSLVTIDVEGIPLKDALPQVLAPLGLAHRVHDGLLVISTADEIEEKFKTVPTVAQDMSPETRAVLAKLERPVAMSYPDLTPIRRVLEDVRRATRGPEDQGVPIDVSPEGLRTAEKTMDSPVTIELKGVPLRTTLRLVLGQLGMGFDVKDGRVWVSELDAVESRGR
jgi:hypothetical protein